MDVQCSAPTPHCGPNGVCVACITNTNCGGTLVCHNNACVQCVSDTQCAGSATTPYCDLSTNRCVQCTSGAECGVNTPYCSSRDTCVQCLADNNCPTGRVCNPTTYRCVQCYSDANCSVDSGHPICNLSTGMCGGCASNGNRSGTTPVCDTQSSTCVQCMSSADCGDAGTCDTTTHTCGGGWCSRLAACCPTIVAYDPGCSTQAASGNQATCQQYVTAFNAYGFCP